jgi:hypothetical protein
MTAYWRIAGPLIPLAERPMQNIPEKGFVVARFHSTTSS